MDNHKLVTIFIFYFFLNMKKMQFLFFMKNMLGKILRFGRMQQNIFFLFENVLKYYYYFFEIFRRKPSILIPDLYFTL